MKGNIGIAEMLLKSGANMNTQTLGFETPLMKAIDNA
jgi:hypothetical protein